MKNIAIVVCLHGNEPYGLEVKDKLPSALPVFIGNPKAIENNVRFTESDLNRSFPGKEDGTYEERLAVDLLKELKKFDYVIDLHSSTSRMELFGIITKLTKEKIELARKLGLKRVAIMTDKLANGCSLIDHLKCAISLEVGPHERKENAQEVVDVINNLISKNITGQDLEVLEIFDIIKGDKNVKYYINNFEEVKKGVLIAEGSRNKYFAPFDFIPLFVGSDYKEVICLASRNIKSIGGIIC